MGERRFSGEIDRLRAPGRLALLEVERVVDLCADGVAVGSVLDVGTGSGVFAEAFARRSWDVTGIDVSARMVEAARRQVPGGRFQQAPAEALPFFDCEFDLAFLGHVLHEVDDPLRALEEARRVALARVAVLEWPYRAEEVGPPLAHRLRHDTVGVRALEAGFAEVRATFLTHMVLYLLRPGGD